MQKRSNSPSGLARLLRALQPWLEARRIAIGRLTSTCQQETIRIVKVNVLRGVS